MRAMSCEILILLFGNGDWIGKESDLLIVSSSCDQGTSWIHTHAVDVGVVDILMDLLHAETEFG